MSLEQWRKIEGSGRTNQSHKSYDELTLFNVKKRAQISDNGTNKKNLKIVASENKRKTTHLFVPKPDVHVP